MLFILKVIIYNYIGGDIMDEKRKYERAGFDCKILYPTIIYKDSKKTFGEDILLYTCDISESGISLHSHFYIPNDSFIYFYLRIPDNLPFRVLIKVCWNKILGNNEYLCGGEFISLSMDEIYILREYVMSTNSKL